MSGLVQPNNQIISRTSRMKKCPFVAASLDSLALCSLHFREIPIGPKNGPPHFLTLACDSAAGLKPDEKWLAAYSKLVEEAGALFGARHYRSYRFLVSLTDQFGHNAIEHHECSDNRMPERMVLDED